MPAYTGEYIRESKNNLCTHSLACFFCSLLHKYYLKRLRMYILSIPFQLITVEDERILFN